jgi:hypothetical protein
VPCETKAYRPPNAAATAGDKRHFVAQCHLFQAAGIDPDRHSSLTFRFNAREFTRVACNRQLAVL